MSIESMMLSNHLILSHPLLLLPFIFPSIRVFSIGSTLHTRWPKYCSLHIDELLLSKIYHLPNPFLMHLPSHFNQSVSCQMERANSPAFYQDCPGSCLLGAVRGDKMCPQITIFYRREVQWRRGKNLLQCSEEVVINFNQEDLGEFFREMGRADSGFGEW